MYYEAAALSSIRLCDCRYLPSFTLFGKNLFYTKQIKDGRHERWALDAMSCGCCGGSEEVMGTASTASEEVGAVTVSSGWCSGSDSVVQCSDNEK